ncbi:uncharacterized protein PGTG_20280 [Puccinia graminis f. sp. tritici CRL 75-36-700-3]|uniref:Uncharacterized protein n=1 Tax=Puccinia graminis f. sp. tritici (strain CRL 75-36-700-3 / race SCCL) TaxID=418459 RepID=E3NXM7_PUCGT|nr:uncharacterized protein PGTG_20280 [Puccinia graminis f. sp. tritici CRL 75-36-700-3]EFP94326.1 hypothetical protein PGTG_20280 [Puccinia graminis f. sp. tritici CRL 75-36-700-3]
MQDSNCFWHTTLQDDVVIRRKLNLDILITTHTTSTTWQLIRAVEFEVSIAEKVRLMGNGMIKRLRNLKTLDCEPCSGDTKASKGVHQVLQPEVPDRGTLFGDVPQQIS